MNELFQPTAHEARIELEAQERKIVLSENEGDGPTINIHLKKRNA